MSDTKPSVPPPAPATKPPVAAPTTKAFNPIEYTGLPPSMARASTWRKWAKLPSRNMSIFLVITGATAYAYYHDRSEVKRLKREYQEKVQHLAQQPMHDSLEHGRKVKVFAARWPEDDDYERGLLHFRKYVKPYLVAAAVDYEMIETPQYGSLTRHLQDTIVARRRIALGLDPQPQSIMSGAPGQLSPAEKEQQELTSGVVLVGRHTLKEYTEGLRRGWLGGVDRSSKEQREKAIERQLEGDGVFETSEQVEAKREMERERAERLKATDDEAPASPLQPRLGGMAFMNRPTPAPTPAPAADTVEAIPSHLHNPPQPLPPTPSIAVVPWINHLGFKQIPYMLASWFTERHVVRESAEAAMRLILGAQRPVDPSSDLDFDAASESYYKSDFAKVPEKIAKKRTSYYAELEGKIKVARELASGARERTKDETTHPPPTEEQLKEERLKKEIRWRNEEEGWEIVRPGSQVPWDERFGAWLKIYDEPADFESPQASAW